MAEDCGGPCQRGLRRQRGLARLSRADCATRGLQDLPSGRSFDVSRAARDSGCYRIFGFHRAFASFVAWSCLAPLWAAAQLTNPLPDLPVAEHPLQLAMFASGLPVQREFVTPVFTQRVGPTDLAPIPNGSGNLIVTTYGGAAFLLNAAGQRSAEPFLDLMNPTSASYNARFEIGDAHGLTSIAFHPQFAEPAAPGYRRFYTLEPETKDSGPADFFESIRPGNDHQDVLYEYQLSSVNSAVCDTECAASKRELLRVTQPGWHHNLGDLLFDANGLLYIGSGDGSTAGSLPPIMSDNSQIMSNIFGKVLRIDPLGNNSANGRYGIPTDNPFRDGPGGALDEIYAAGLRNPFRLEDDPVTGQLFASETGELTIESIEAIRAGGNYGWNVMEGEFLYDRISHTISIDEDANQNGVGDVAEANGFVAPLFQYDHDDGRAIVGAVPYRGTDIPWLQGQVVFSDFASKLFYGDVDTGQAYKVLPNARGEKMPFNVHSVNRDANGEVYILGITDLGDDLWDGIIVRLQAAPAVDGDFDYDSLLTVADIDGLTTTVRQGLSTPRFDINLDGQVDQQDRTIWVVDRKHTWFGDANLNGEFDSADLVTVLQAGQYEDQLSANSTWATGDWNGDGDFTTADFVVALAQGGYEQGPRPAQAVPEPAMTGGLLATAVVLTGRRRRT